jgi:hypothetical protein
MRRFLLALAAAFALTTPPSIAQNLTADDVADAYVEAVALCARAKVAGVTIARLTGEDRARVAEASAQMRGLARAPDGRPVWDVLSARGIVVIAEPTDSQCDVTAYGPRVRPVFNRVARALSEQPLGFAEVETQQDPSAILRAFERVEGERRTRVLLDGGEPGMPGRMSRFPVLVAFVSSN